MIDISNKQFLEAIFGDSYIYAHVTSFSYDPGNIPCGDSGKAWAGGYYKDTPLTVDSNQFYTVSLFVPDEHGRSRRRKANFSACHVIGLDDVREKLPVEQVEKLPPPSSVLKSSLHSEQWLYILDTPETSIDRIDNLHDGLIASDLAPDSKDPGQRGVTRYLRLPEGCNTKAKRIEENNGFPPKSQIIEWHPERRYTLEELAQPFSVDLGAPRKGARIEGATDINDHPLLSSSGLHVKSRRSPGRYDITCPWVNEHTGGEDNGAAVFTNEDNTIGFKCHHGGCDDRTAKDFLEVLESNDPGFNTRLEKFKSERMFIDIPASSREVDPFMQFNAVGEINAMKEQMLADKYILKNLAILGQWTVFYASPNIGKTLLTLWLLRECIQSGELNAADVYYANCDDTFKGGLEKLEIAKKSDFKMMLPGINGFSPEALIDVMRKCTEHVKGKVIILDTLKKFTDLMDKKLSSEFGKIAREFVAGGGSIICLAHVNKAKDSSGRSIHAGTSDISDDADCVYVIDEVFMTTEKRTVEFRNTKCRGSVVATESFQYTTIEGSKYQDIIDSVCRVSKVSVKEEFQLYRDAEVIKKIKYAITDGVTSKRGIEEFVAKRSDYSMKKVKSVVEEYQGQLWEVAVGDKNRHKYSLIKAPPVMSFL